VSVPLQTPSPRLPVRLSIPRISRNISRRSTWPNAPDQTLGIAIRSLFFGLHAFGKGMNFNPVNASQNMQPTDSTTFIDTFRGGTPLE
jgi:hypothetical protein